MLYRQRMCFGEKVLINMQRILNIKRSYLEKRAQLLPVRDKIRQLQTPLSEQIPTSLHFSSPDKLDHDKICTLHKLTTPRLTAQTETSGFDATCAPNAIIHNIKTHAISTKYFK